MTIRVDPNLLQRKEEERNSPDFHDLPVSKRPNERLVYDSSKGPYKKEKKMGIEGVENLTGNQGDPGDEQQVGQPAHIRENMAENSQENPPSTDAHPGEPGDSGHEVSTGHPDDLSEHPDAVPSPSGTPAEGLQATPAESVDAPRDPQEPEATGTN